MAHFKGYRLLNIALNKSVQFLFCFVFAFQNNSAGLLCDQCKNGFFYLAGSNPKGCTSCVCMGITENCTSTKQFRKQVVKKFKLVTGIVLTKGRFTIDYSP